MFKRKLREEGEIHISSTDPKDRGPDSSKFNDDSNYKKICVSPKFKEKVMGSDHLYSELNMENSMSTKSTSEGDNLDEQEVADKMEVSNQENVVPVSLPGTEESKELYSFKLLSSQEKIKTEDSQFDKYVEKTKDSENVSNKSVSESDSQYEYSEDNSTEVLTPSKRADYVHTLLSGRSSLDQSINLLTKIKTEPKCKTELDVDEDKRDEKNPVVKRVKNEENSESPRCNLEKEDKSVRSEGNEEYGETKEEMDLDCDKDDNYEDEDGEEVECKEIEQLIGRYKTLYSVSSNKVNDNGKLRVVVRCRPSESINKVVECDNKSIKLLKEGDKNSVLKSQRPRIYEFQFDYIVRENETTKKLYEDTCSDLVEKILEGTSVTVFAYGSTGSGKTYTITGNESSVGLIYLVMKDLFEKRKGSKKELYASYFEVYNENVYDLLKNDEKNLQLQENENVVFVKGLTKVKVEDYEEFRELFDIGNKNRKVFATNANRCSSRSHTILQIQTESKSRLTFIDLAGSERIKITENKGDRFKESSYINQSLLALINCINTLSRNSNCLSKSRSENPGEGQEWMSYERVKYRDSKLTHLLKNSLTSNCFIMMIAHINPENKFYQDSYNTIKYALRAKDVEITKKITKGKCGKEIIKKFSKELLNLVNFMKSNMNEEQLELTREHISQCGTIGQPILLELLK